jgi:ATP-binding cassette subfamily B protein/subfamily B ATP-binding cassette protein MsbA
MAVLMKSPNREVTSLSRWIASYVLGRWRGMTVILAMMLFKVAVDLVRPWPTKILVDNALRREPLSTSTSAALASFPGGVHSPSDLIAWCVLATVLLFLIGWLLAAALAIASVSVGKQLSYDLAGDLFAHLQRLSLRFHTRRSTGDSIRRVLIDSGCLSAFVRDAIIPVVTAIVMLALMIAILWRLNPQLAVVSLSVIPIIGLAFHRYAKPMTETSYAQQRVDARIYETVERALSSVPAIQAFGRETHFDSEFRAVTADALGATLRATDVQLKFKTMIGVATALGTAGLLWVGAYQFLAGKLTAGGLLVFLSYLATLYSPVSVLAYSSATVQGATASARRVHELWQTSSEPRDRPGAAVLVRADGEIRLEHVSVGYEPGRPVLQDVTFHARVGQMIAIVGPTGAGKSTLVSLIPRFIDPWAGRVTLDGHDLRDLSIESLRRRVALVLQDSFLFPISIAQNIAYGRPGASSREIEAAARTANAHEFIVRLPDGYDTVIGERGATLSGGERQRLSIARALLKDAPVLILDEPTASLDVLTESLLLDALRRLSNGRTTFVIAHRLSTIRAADTILVVQRGRIVEAGSHDALVAARGEYAGLYTQQFAPARHARETPAPAGRAG